MLRLRRRVSLPKFAALLCAVCAAAGHAALSRPAQNAGPPQNISLSNTATYLGKGRYDWRVYVKADPATLKAIKGVEYRLDPAYGATAKRYVTEPRDGSYPFFTKDTAFEPSVIRVKVYFNDRDPVSLPAYTLKLAGAPGESPAPKPRPQPSKRN